MHEIFLFSKEIGQIVDRYAKLVCDQLLTEVFIRIVLGDIFLHRHAKLVVMASFLGTDSRTDAI